MVVDDEHYHHMYSPLLEARASLPPLLHSAKAPLPASVSNMNLCECGCYKAAQSQRRVSACWLRMGLMGIIIAVALILGLTVPPDPHLPSPYATVSSVIGWWVAASV